MKKVGIRGFTLIEVLIVLAVSSLVGTLLLNLWVQNNRVFYQQTLRVDQTLSLTNSSSKITDLLRQSSGIVVSYTTYASSNSILVAQLPSINASDQVIENVYDHLVIFADASAPKILRLKIFPNVQSTRKSEDEVLTTKLATIVFAYLDNNNNVVSPIAATKIRYTINTSEKAGSADESNNVQQTVNLRNN